MSGETTSASRPSPHQGRRLKAQRLAAAGRQDDDAVARREDRVHRLALQRAEAREAPDAVQRFSEDGIERAGRAGRISVWRTSARRMSSTRRWNSAASSSYVPRRVVTCSPSMKTGQFGASPVPGQADADVRGLRFARAVDDAAHDGERHRFDALMRRLPLGHPVADVVLNPLGQLLKRAARRAAAAGTRGDARRKRPQAQRLQELARGVDLLAPVAAGPRRQRHADRVADPFVRAARPSPTPTRRAPSCPSRPRSGPRCSG